MATTYKSNKLRLILYTKEKYRYVIEFVDGVVYMSPSSSTRHQRISGRLNAKLFVLLEKKGYEVFQAPFDVELCSERSEGNKVVIPDLSVICDKSGLCENMYAYLHNYRDG